ncbi:acid phosphatase 1 [Elaeis guineensis]|uniref:Acid phosphatase 1 n=1 Tax=Elaeis guineensis var. tenera TaxID=51953 RepID=A0A6I9QT50_ELAGV|nr:acid phosphatase 1 [Elaeis guineensis]
MLQFHRLLLCFLVAAVATSQTHLEMVAEDPSGGLADDPKVQYCESWRLAVETNNAGEWKKVPSRCVDVVADYIKGPQYLTDSKMVARLSHAYAKTVQLAGDGKDVWIFDVDETLISNFLHYTLHGYESRMCNETAYDQWVYTGKATALPWSLWLYRKLQSLGFQLVLLTGRKEHHRNSTEQNLMAVGYRSWKKLILRESLDATKTAMTYKSEKRAELEAEGYTIHGSSGDQWSDLLGPPMAKRSFKLPNPMYHIP